VDYKLQAFEEFRVSRLEVETYAFEYEGNRDALSVTLEVISDDALENKRDITGEIYISALDPNDKMRQPPFHGECIFYTEKKFRVDLMLPAAVVERLWQAHLVKPEWFLICLEGPDIPAIAKSYEGEFRVRFRAGRMDQPAFHRERY
jgi:hypothetical protein